ncbi:MAG: hypothetical protein N2438_08205, partial [Limisphaera sp.]|nr:hypothetical protein [Limisphaera sp.]
MKTRWIIAGVFSTFLMVTGQEARVELRRWSLTDCIQQCLEYNLELRIEHYNPELALFNLRSGYGAYDPVFRSSVQHDYNKA